MSAFAHFDPAAYLREARKAGTNARTCDSAEPAAKVAKVAKVRGGDSETLATLATLARSRSQPGPSEPIDSEPGDPRPYTGRLKVSFGNEAKGVPPQWTDGVTKLLELSASRGVLPARWQTLQRDAAKFIEIWGGQAARLGWTVYDVYGVNAIKPFSRLDAAGLVRLLDGREVVALTENEAVVQCTTGSRQTFRRKAAGVVPAIERCLLWELSGDADTAVGQ